MQWDRDTLRINLSDNNQQVLLKHLVGALCTKCMEDSPLPDVRDLAAQVKLEAQKKLDNGALPSSSSWSSLLSLLML